MPIDDVPLRKPPEYVAGENIPKGSPLRVGGVPVTPASVFPPRKTPPVQKPIPDGWLVITTIHGTQHTYLNRDMPRGWRPIGSGLLVSTPTGRIIWTWRNILSYEIFANSEDFAHAHRRWHAYEAAEAARLAAEAEEDDCVGADGD
jgi:hypothetical protein